MIPPKPTHDLYDMKHMNEPKTMNTRHQAILRTGLAGITSTLTLGGCTAPTPPPLIFPGGTTTTAQPEDRWRASLDGEFDRRAWPAIRFEISMASVPCNPTYATPVVPDDDGVGRLGETGAFPTIDTAMSTETDRGRVRWSAVAEPFVAAFDLVASPFRMIGAPPDSTVLEPNGAWVLLPNGETPPPVEDVREPDDTLPPDGAADPPPAEDAGSSEEAGAAGNTTADSGGWTISPAFDRPADAATAPRTTE